MSGNPRPAALTVPFFFLLPLPTHAHVYAPVPVPVLSPLCLSTLVPCSLFLVKWEIDSVN